ncbi:MAG: ribosome biogenesis GTPase Der [Christensenellales bacterium]
MKPVVAIVGRPNVGKSTLFNRMAGQRISIVKDTPGVTRDRIYADVEWNKATFMLIDTGGLDTGSEDELLSLMRRQVEFAVEMADVIVFLVDGKYGIQSGDQEIASYLRKTNKTILVAVNKLDSPEKNDDAFEFYGLGFDEVYGVSSEHGLGTGDLLDAIVTHLPHADDEADESGLKIAVVGRPNVGKSSLVNRILNEDRLIVSDIAGTTRDAVDTKLEYQGNHYTFIDTAGIRRKSKIDEKSVERYGVIRAINAIRRCDVAILMLDAFQGIVEQDVKIAGLIDEEGKPSVIVVNKWDLVEKDTYTMNRFRDTLKSEMEFMSYAPSLFISVKTGQRVDKLFELVQYVDKQSRFRVPTGILNEMLAQAQTTTPPPTDKGKRLKIFYATQAQIQPPTFVLFVNDSALMHFSYKRYLENFLRKTFQLDGTPIRIIIREREE